MTNIEIGMMVAFILALGFSGWKLYVFMPSEPLEDDDMNKVSTQALKTMMYDVIAKGTFEKEAIVKKMQSHSMFEQKHFWRFNLNRLNQLLNSHYIEYPHHNSVKDIHKHLNKTD